MEDNVRKMIDNQKDFNVYLTNYLSFYRIWRVSHLTWKIQLFRWRIMQGNWRGRPENETADSGLSSYWLSWLCWYRLSCLLWSRNIRTLLIILRLYILLHKPIIILTYLNLLILYLCNKVIIVVIKIHDEIKCLYTKNKLDSNV